MKNVMLVENIRKEAHRPQFAHEYFMKFVLRVFIKLIFTRKLHLHFCVYSGLACDKVISYASCFAAKFFISFCLSRNFLNIFDMFEIYQIIRMLIKLVTVNFLLSMALAPLSLIMNALK